MRIYIWIGVLVAIGIAISIFLFPVREDVALMFLKGKKYTEAELYYKEQYLSGDRSSDVILALKSLELKEGNIGEAITLVEEYLEEHPGNIYALQLLAGLYRDNQEYDKYFQVLEKIYQIQPTKESLQELAFAYQTRNRPEDFCAALEQLISIDEGDADNYLDLAYCYVSKKEYEKAYATLEERRERFPREIEINDILLEAWILHKESEQLGDPALERKGAALVADFLLEKDEPKIVPYALNSALEYYPRQLPYLVERLQPMIEKNPGLEQTVIAILWQNESAREMLFPNLLQLHGARPANPTTQRLLFEAFINYRYDYLLVGLIRNTPPSMYTSQTVFDIAAYSIVHDKPEIARELQNALGPSYFESEPLDEALLAIAAKEKGAKAKLERFMESKTIISSDLYKIMQIASLADYPEIVEQAGARLSPFFEMNADELFYIALFYIRIGKEKEFYEMLLRDLAELGKKKTEAALALLHTAMGKSKRAAEWLSEQEKPRESMLIDFYTVAHDKKEYPFALFVAKLLKERYPSARSEAYYAAALVGVGRIKQGMVLLSDSYRKNPEDREISRLYFNALKQAAEKNPAYIAQLRAYMKEEEEKGLPSPAISREYAYTYIEILHDYGPAEALLQGLADRGEETPDDVQTLIYLWGPQVTAEQRNWIVKKAEEADCENLESWLDNLTYIGEVYKVIELFEQKIGMCCPDEIKPRVIFAYIEALAYLKWRCEVRQAVDRFYCFFTDLEDLKKLAAFAEQVQLYDIRREIWEYAVKKEPCNPAVWYELSKALFEQGDYCAAVPAIMGFFNVCRSLGISYPKTYEILYEYGVILDAHKCYKEAQEHFCLSIQDIVCKWDATNYRMMEILALDLEGLNADCASLSVMNRLYERTSLSPDIAASLSNLMMNMGKIRKAREFLLRGS